jgi:hypothetical protein
MPKNILFVGNSYTFCNYLPGMVKALAASGGIELNEKMSAVGGKTLEWHYYNQPTVETVISRNWDYFVMQEFSTGSIENPDKMFASAKRLAAKLTSPETQLALYMTWNRKFHPETQKIITNNYLKLAKELNAIAVPCGPAWEKAVEQRPDLNLYVEDQSHPNELGTYLNACVFCAKLFDLKPIGLTNIIPQQTEGVSLVIKPELAEFLQNIAEETCTEF